MKYIKLFDSYNALPSIKDLGEYNIRNYTINIDGTIDVDGDVYLNGRSLKKIPFKFGIVNGTFDVSFSELESLKGSPRICNGDFICTGNGLTNLKYSPDEVSDSFFCDYNLLTSLEGMPSEIGADFDCSENPNLKELKSMSNVEGDIYCDKDLDTSKFEGYCKAIKIIGFGEG